MRARRLAPRARFSCRENCRRGARGTQVRPDPRRRQGLVLRFGHAVTGLHHSALVSSRLPRGGPGRPAGRPPAPGAGPAGDRASDAGRSGGDGEGRASESRGGSRPRPRAVAVGLRAAAVRSGRHRCRRAGHRVRHEHEPEQPAAGHPAAPDWYPTVHTLQTVEGPARVLPPRARAGTKREEHVDRGSQQRRLTRLSRLHRVQGARLPDRGYRRRRLRRRLAHRRSKGSTTTVCGTSRPGCSCTAAICSSACRRASTGCATGTATARSRRGCRSAKATTSIRRSAGTAFPA